MARGGYSIRSIAPSEVNLDFARDLQGIAQRAWTAGLAATRTPEEVAEAFNPDDPNLIARAHDEYLQVAELGHLVVVSAYPEGRTIGFAMGINDMSPYGNTPTNLLKRGGKRASIYAGRWSRQHFGGKVLHLPNKEYGKIQHVAMETDAPKGAATLAIKAVAGQFEDDQTLTAYIDDENEQSKAFFGGFGFVWDGETVKPVYRFGEHNKPTMQRRYKVKVPEAIQRGGVILDAMAQEQKNAAEERLRKLHKDA